MKGIKRFFLSRTTILTLIILALGAMLVGSFVPQAFLLSKAGLVKWHADYPIMALLAERLGLTHVYTHPVFAIILALVIFSLLLSCLEQFQISWRRTFGEAPALAEKYGFTSELAEPVIARYVRSAGYRPVGGGEAARYLRHPWGLWGNCLLHVGMLVVIASSLWIALTQQRGLQHIAVGETFYPSQPWVSTEKGLLAKELVLDDSVRLEQLRYEFWPSSGVKTVASTITFLRDGVPPATRTVEINSILGYDGMRIYQGIDFGHAFYVEVTDASGRQEVFQLLFNHQLTADKPSYNEFVHVLGDGMRLRGKYFVDEKKVSLASEDPLLVLRVDHSGKQLGQLPLKLGSAGAIGPYQFRLVKIGKWSSLFFVKLTGISGIFVGFFIIVLGAALNYFTPPREVVTQRLPDGRMVVSWRITKFAEFYRGEFERLEAQLTGEKFNG